MPELPDLVVYQESLTRLVTGTLLREIKLFSPFVLRTAVPPLAESHGRRVERIELLGKRVVIGLEGKRFLVIHLMRAGRLRWLGVNGRSAGRGTLARLDFESGSLAFTEAGTRRSASLHYVVGADALLPFDAGGLDVLAASTEQFVARLRGENHTLKRALVSPPLFAGIGGAYSDEILHRARLSPIAMTRSLTDEEAARLHDAARAVLTEWTDRLRRAAGTFPENVTAFRPEMAVHGRYRQPCPVCATPVQRIVYVDSETNYCPRCQTGGKVLADRALSRLLHSSWPRTADELG